MNNSNFYNIITHIKKPWFICLWAGLMVFSYFFIDKQLMFFWRQDPSQSLYFMMQWLTLLGLGGWYLIGFPLLFLIFRMVIKNSLYAANCLFLFATILLSGLCCDLIKIIVGRARPVEWFHDHLFGFYFYQLHSRMWSFPSGHTTTIFGLMVGLSLLKPKFAWVFMPIAFLVAVSRLVITAHYLSDVLGGMFLGTLITILVYDIYRKYQDILLAKLGAVEVKSGAN